MHALTRWLDDLTAESTDSAGRRRAPLALLVLAALLFLPLLGHYGLWDPAEVRIAEIAKEMAHSKTWIVPARAPGPRTPLLYWALSVGYRTGSGEWAGRLPIALLSLWEYGTDRWFDALWFSSPLRVLRHFWSWAQDDLLKHLVITLRETFIGYSCGTLLGIAAGVLMEAKS